MIAIIPARAGSKGLPGKNVKNFNGKPLIAHTIESALRSKHIDRVVVTTDSEEIARVARDFGAEVPFIRPDEISDDQASAIDVYLHAVDFLRTQQAEIIENFVVLLPTVPLRTSQDIDGAIELFERSCASTLVSMVCAAIPPSWYYKICDNVGKVTSANFDQELSIKNRQSNSCYYHPNGAIYILSYSLLKESRTYYCDETVAYIMPEDRSVDIDTPLDFAFAEFLAKA